MSVKEGSSNSPKISSAEGLKPGSLVKLQYVGKLSYRTYEFISGAWKFTDRNSSHSWVDFNELSNKFGIFIGYSTREDNKNMSRPVSGLITRQGLIVFIQNAYIFVANIDIIQITGVDEL